VRHDEGHVIRPIDLMVSLEDAPFGVVPLQIGLDIFEPILEDVLRNREVQKPEGPMDRLTVVNDHVVLVLVLISIFLGCVPAQTSLFAAFLLVGALPFAAASLGPRILSHFSTDQGISIKPVSDLLDCQEVALGDRHGRGHEFQIRECFSPGDEL